MAKLESIKSANAVHRQVSCICERKKIDGKTFIARSPACVVHSEVIDLNVKNLGAMQPGS